MIPVERVPEPASFDEDVRKRGARWLEGHPPPADLRPLWLPYLPELAAGFQHRCGYAAMHIENGTVDHYLSTSTHRELAYEWSNYRFASERLNSIKRAAGDRVLDPFAVGEGWFEIVLPSLQLVATSSVPEELRAQAEFTLKRLRLRDDERIVRLRRRWYEQFLSGKVTLGGLADFAPLLARAIDKRLQRIDPRELEADRAAYAQFLANELTLPGLRRAAPRAAEAVDRELQRPDTPRP